MLLTLFNISLCSLIVFSWSFLVLALYRLLNTKFYSSIVTSRSERQPVLSIFLSPRIKDLLLSILSLFSKSLLFHTKRIVFLWNFIPLVSSFSQECVSWRNNTLLESILFLRYSNILILLCEILIPRKLFRMNFILLQPII